MTEDNEGSTAPEDVNDLLERIDQAWSDLLAAMDGVPDDHFEDPGVAGDWSLKELFGHIAFWDEHAIAEIERALAGQPRQDNEWQAMNDADHAARQGRTLAEERAAMHQAHAALLERLEAIANIDATRVDAAVRPGSYDHYQEHIPDIQQWRQRAGV
jgi:hypothetical protein